MFISLVLALIQPEPVIPIPTGSAIDPGPFIGWVVSPDGVHWRAGHLDDGVERHAFHGSLEEWSIIEKTETEFTRTAVSKLKNSVIPERIFRHEGFLLNSWSYSAELVASVRRPGAKATVFWYPIEGVQFSVGLDLLRRCPFSGLQLFF